MQVFHERWVVMVCALLVGALGGCGSGGSGGTSQANPIPPEAKTPGFHAVFVSQSTLEKLAAYLTANASGLVASDSSAKPVPLSADPALDAALDADALLVPSDVLRISFDPTLLAATPVVIHAKDVRLEVDRSAEPMPSALTVAPAVITGLLTTVSALAPSAAGIATAMTPTAAKTDFFEDDQKKVLTAPNGTLYAGAVTFFPGSTAYHDVTYKVKNPTTYFPTAVATDLNNGKYFTGATVTDKLTSSASTALHEMAHVWVYFTADYKQYDDDGDAFIGALEGVMFNTVSMFYQQTLGGPNPPTVLALSGVYKTILPLPGETTVLPALGLPTGSMPNFVSPYPPSCVSSGSAFNVSVRMVDQTSGAPLVGSFIYVSVNADVNGNQNATLASKALGEPIAVQADNTGTASFTVTAVDPLTTDITVSVQAFGQKTKIVAKGPPAALAGLAGTWVGTYQGSVDESATYGCSLSISGSLKWVITPSCTLSVAESATGKTWDTQCQNVTDNPASGTVTGTSSDGITLKLSGTAWTGSEVITATVSGNSISASVTAKSADNGNESFTYSLTKQ